MNETLRRALLQVRLTEEDVAARLQVDPKTVRRWLEGRVPYLRHRWALAALLGVDEADLWPQLRGARARSDEVRAIYPHLGAVPHEVWLRLFCAAQREIAILDHSALFLAEDPGIVSVLAGRAKTGVSVRICLTDPATAVIAGAGIGNGIRPADIRTALAVYEPLRSDGDVQIRLHRATLYHSIFIGDDHLLIAHHAYGIPAPQAPVLCVDHTDGGMGTTYAAEFEVIWKNAQPAE